MSQNALVQAKETDLSVLAHNNNKYAFINESKRFEGVMDIIETDEGPSGLLNGQEYPLFDGAFAITLVQSQHGGANSKFKKHDGEIYIQDLETFSAERKLLPICVVREGRHLFPSYNASGGDNSPLCQSLNGITPSTRNGLPVNDVCARLRTTANGKVYKEAVCPKAVWDGSTPAECKNFYDVAFLDITEEDAPLPVIMRFKSTALAPLRDLRKALESKARVARVRKASAAPKSWYISLKAEDKSNYYIPSLTIVDCAEGEASPSRFTPLCCYYRDTIFATPMPIEEPALAAENSVSEEERLEAIDVSSEDMAGSEGVGFTL